MRATRREFLRTTGSLVGGLALTSWLGRSAWAADKPAPWRITVRDAVAKATKKDNCWEALQAAGAEGVEIGVAQDLSLPYFFHPTKKYTLATAEGIAEFAADAKAAGVPVTAFCMSNHFEQETEAEIKACTAAALAAQQLGAPAIRLDVVPAKLSREEFLALSIKALKQIIANTESTGVAFGVENHGSTTNDPTFTQALFDGVGSPRLGLTLDAGNFYWFGHPQSKLYDIYAQFAPRVVHTHCKSIRYPDDKRDAQRERGWKYDVYGCPIDEGDIDYARLMTILNKAGYQNDMCIENEFLGRLSGEEATKVLAREIAFLKKIRADVVKS